MMRYLTTFLLSLLLAATAATAAADDAAARLQERLSEVNSLRADFRQRVEDEYGELQQESTGELIVQRPLSLYWETTDPFHYVIVSDGDTLWRYDVELEQLNSEPFQRDLARTPILILTASVEEITERFEVEYTARGKGGDSFVLTPRQEAPFLRLALHFERERLSAIELLDTLEQQTRIELSERRFNETYDADRFVFDEERFKATP